MRPFCVLRTYYLFSLKTSKMEPIDLSLGRPGTTKKFPTRESNQRLEERLDQLESNHKIKERDVKVLEIKLAQEIIDLKEGLNYVVSEVTNAHQRIEDHEKEMKQLDLQKQFLWARVDELRVQMIPLEKADDIRTRIPVTQNDRALPSILAKKAQTPNPGKENEQTLMCEKDRTPIPNHDNERGQISICENEQPQMLTAAVERVWIPTVENERVHMPAVENDWFHTPNPLLDNSNTSTEASVITTERADMAVKAVDVNNTTEISVVEQDSGSIVNEATQINNSSRKSTFPCEICSKEFSKKISLRSHKIFHSRKNKKHFLRKGVGSWKCIYCNKKFKYAKSCEDHESNCTFSRIEKQRSVSADSNEAGSIPTTENHQTIFPDSVVENSNLGVISALDICDSEMELNNVTQNPKRQGRSKSARPNPNPLNRSQRKSNEESSSVSNSLRKELWKCIFCQKGFTYSESYRNRHEKRCPSRNLLNQSAVRADSSVESTQEISLEHGKHKRYKENPLQCVICRAEFMRKCHLVRHMLKHNPSSWFQCSDCEYRTHRTDNLALHMAKHN